MYAIIPNKDTLFALAACQRKLTTAFSEHFAPQLVACPTYPLWAFSETALPHAISSCRILAPRLLQEDAVIVFPVELVSPCGNSSPLSQASPADAIGTPPYVAGEGSQLCALASPSVWGDGPPRVVDTQEGSVWQFSIVAARVLCSSTEWGFAHGLHLEWQPSGCDGFPRNERVFRVGKVKLEGTGWRLVREHWCKIK